MDFSKKYIREKKRVLKIAQNSLKVLNRVLESRVRNRVFSKENLEKLEELRDIGKSYLKKLEKDSFEIAIVGLEKAGKSTFANAIIESNVLPSAPERCTFTSTKLLYGEDKASILLYSRDEFEKIFLDMLRELEFPINSKTSFETLSLSDFEDFFEELKEKNSNLYNLHLGKSDEEIRDILKYRDLLELSGNEYLFSGEELYSEKFQSYIRGVKRGVETDTSKPRSVKSIRIESSKLSQLQNSVIFDVPGFDSPTKIHERQTSERLKSADAIVLVTNAGDRPNITAPQLDTIRKDSDFDGIKLSEKLFVFGNKMDTAISLEIVENNRRYLENDVVNRYKIAQKHRVFTGSALKYLVETETVERDKYHEKFELESGILEIRNELISYYESDRFEILKRKVSNFSNQIREILLPLLNREDAIRSQNSENIQRSVILRKAFKDIDENLRENLQTLKMELKKEILEGLYFTNRFRDDTNRLEYFEPISGELFDKVEKGVSNSLTTETPVERVNHQIREILHQKYLRDFTTLIKSMTDEKAKEIDEKILVEFLKGLGSDEVRTESIEFINSITKDIAHNEGRFFYLIDRFSRDLFDILLLYPVKSEDRLKKFETSGVEFKFLDNYYNGGDGSLVNLVLSQKDSKSSGKAEDILKNTERSSTKSGVIKEINKDIENLKNILKKGIIRAINLEVAFLNSVDKKIKIILDSILKNGSLESNLFDEFIARVVPKIKRDEFGNIENRVQDGEDILSLIYFIKESEI